MLELIGDREHDVLTVEARSLIGAYRTAIWLCPDKQWVHKACCKSTGRKHILTHRGLSVFSLAKAKGAEVRESWSWRLTMRSQIFENSFAGW